MPSITQFNDFMQTTGPAYLKSADAVINEAVKNNYVLSRLLKEKATETLIQAGSSIKDTIVFDDASTYQKYQPTTPSLGAIRRSPTRCLPRGVSAWTT
jgi:hypothetical protein